ncbi:hypothetical protein AB3N04_05095 [Alkalihalophilus sp. As8PL]|uniref:Uncharacterized protein n=1 Tax=Alkalihalophilus sp. As8PL TaxID=3237103 RepID=A0AB39BV65_9BACI
MQINKDTKLRDLPESIQKHLQVLASFQTKQALGSITFILFNLMLFPILVPFMDLYAWLTLPLVVIMNGWCIYLMFRNTYTIQLHAFLYIGILSCVGAWGYFISTQKYAYHVLELQSPVFFLITAAGMAIVVFAILQYYKKKMSDTSTKEKKRPTSTISYLLVGIAPGMGILFYHQVTKQSELSLVISMVGAFYIFAVFFAYFSVKFIHKYLFMRANRHLVRLEKPLKKSKNPNIEVR